MADQKDEKDSDIVPVTICPPGEAFGSHDLRRDGNPLCFWDLTVRPRHLHFSLSTGKYVPGTELEGFGPTRLFQQEYVVFMKQMTPYFRAQILLDAIENQARKDRALKGAEGMKATIVQANYAQEYGKIKKRLASLTPDLYDKLAREIQEKDEILQWNDSEWVELVFKPKERNGRS